MSAFIRNTACDVEVINVFIQSLKPWTRNRHLLDKFMPEAQVLTEMWMLMVRGRCFQAFELRQHRNAVGAWAWRIVVQVKQDYRVSGNGQLFNRLYCDGERSRHRSMNPDTLANIVRNTRGNVEALSMSLTFRALSQEETWMALIYVHNDSRYVAVSRHLLSYLGDTTHTKALKAALAAFAVTSSWFQCPVCLDQKPVGLRTACGHEFCRSCVVNWLVNTNLIGRCPLCRGAMVKEAAV